MTMYRASVIIPSHQRAVLLPRTLNALARQDFPYDQFEVIVAADACTDSTVEVVQDYSTRAPYRLRVVAHHLKSASATRNFGARHAEGATFIFVDDDIEASPSLVRAHMAIERQDSVTVGCSKPALPSSPSQWQLEARLWWEDHYRKMRQPGHRFGYRDFFSGNFALSAELFHRTGGFDPSFNRLEDYEYGFRLLQSGARLIYAPEAVGLHHYSTDLPQWVHRIRDEGESDVQLGTLYPVLRRQLFGSPKMRGPRGVIQRLAFLMHGNGDGLVKAGLRIAAALENLKLRRRRNSLVSAVRMFNYWRGVTAATGSIAAFTEWAEDETNAATIAADAPCLEWTTLPTMPRLEELLAEGSRKGIRILIGGIEALTIPAEPWSEPLRREHIELTLSRFCAEQLVPALVPGCIKKLLLGNCPD
jgi:glycosyltransferase involved in cell wall biosynthesis